MFGQIGIISAVMVTAYGFSQWRKLSVELSMLASAVAGGLAGACAGTPAGGGIIAHAHPCLNNDGDGTLPAPFGRAFLGTACGRARTRKTPGAVHVRLNGTDVAEREVALAGRPLKRRELR